MELKGTVLVITGGASGIGGGVVEAFLKEGCKHAAFLDINETVGKEFEAKLTKTYGNGKAKFIKCDATKEEDIDNALKQVIKEQGYFDIMINNAGIMTDGRNIYKKAIELNVTGVVTGSFKAIDYMRKDHGGRGGTIINISSVAGLCQTYILPVYWAAKSAVLQFSNCLGMEPRYSRTGVRVITICFGKTDTNLLANLSAFDEETTKDIPKVIAEFKMQKPENAVAAVVEVFKSGASGSTWISTNNKPPRDITDKVKEAYAILASVCE